MRVTFEVEDEEALRVLRRVLAALDVKETPAEPVAAPVDTPPEARKFTGPVFFRTEASTIFIRAPDGSEHGMPAAASRDYVAAMLESVDPNAGPLRVATSMDLDARVAVLHPAITPLLDAADVDEWWCYLDNGERVAEVPNPAYWPEIALAVMALVGVPPEPWNLRMMPRTRGTADALPEGMQTRVLRPEDAAWKDVEGYLEAFMAERDNAREAARYREAVGTPVPPAFFHPVPFGAVQWRLTGEGGVLLGVVPAHATRKNVLSALYEHLRAEPQEFGAECVLANPDADNSNGRAFLLSARDLHPVPFAATSSPWLHVSAEPWVPPSRVPAYATREEVARHVRVVASPEWFEEVRLHGVTLDVQPLDVDLIPVGDPFTVSLFSQDFS